MSRSGPTSRFVARWQVLPRPCWSPWGCRSPRPPCASEPTNMVLVWNENAVSVISNPVTPPPARRRASARRRRSRRCTSRWSRARSTTRSTPSTGATSRISPACPRRRPPRRPPPSPRRRTTSCSASCRRRRTAVIDQDRRPADHSLALDRPRSGQGRTASTIGAAAAAAMLAARSQRRPLRRRAVGPSATNPASGCRCRPCPTTSSASSRPSRRSR